MSDRPLQCQTLYASIIMPPTMPLHLAIHMLHSPFELKRRKSDIVVVRFEVVSPRLRDGSLSLVSVLLPFSSQLATQSHECFIAQFEL